MNQELNEKGRLLKNAAAQLAALSDRARRDALLRVAEHLEKRQTQIMAANQEDLRLGEANGISKALLDRMALSPERIAGIAEGLRQVAQLPDVLGRVQQSWQRPNGLQIERVSVPLGVIGMIYEARPNVTVDAAGLCLKTGNAVLLRGGTAVARSNQVLVNLMQEALGETEVPASAVQLLTSPDREAVKEMLKLNQYLDVVIPRGGGGLIQMVVREATVPVIETGVGVCHTYIDRAADPEMAIRIAVNAKTNRPSVCNAMETLLVHRSWAESHLTKLADVLREKGVEIRGCAVTRHLLDGLDIAEATEDDWAAEYLDLILSVKVVEDLPEALAHIARYGTKHSEAIVTEDKAAAEAFLSNVDAAAAYHNASTRFTDGFEFGFGAEIGISTQKLHARGPMGLEALTSYKYKIRGSGQIKGS
jgi:glutamate-5-semialdehyde dehydrogenase